MNSIVISTVATILTTAAAAVGAYAFARLRFAGKEIVFNLAVATLAIPAYSVMIPVYRMLVTMHLIDTYVGITLVHVSTFLPLALWLTPVHRQGSAGIG